MPFTSRKFATEVSWNMVSFGVMGLAGIFVNILIAKYHGAATLGVFNRVYAIFIFLSQFAVAGIHFSVLKNISQFSDFPEKAGDIFAGGILATTIISTVVVAITYLGSGLFSYLLESEGVGLGVRLVLPGLFFFSLNKTCLAFHNGCRRMKAYAVLQALRYIFLITSLLALIAFSVEGSRLPVIFTFSEFLLFIVLFTFTLKHCKIRYSREVLCWVREHCGFGGKATVGNILIDVNTRVDVLMLGLFTSDRIVGIYSFAAMLAEGFSQLPIVLRANVNPIITKYRFENSNVDLEVLIRRGVRLLYLYLVPVGILAVACFSLVFNLFGLGEEFSDSWAVFAILMTGILLSVGYLPFQMLLNQVGSPGFQTVFIASIFVTNVVLNMLLIPMFGMFGAAIATSMSVSAQVLYLKILVRKVVGINI